MQEPPIAPIVGNILNSRMHFFQIRNESFRRGYSASTVVVPSCRFILVTRGAISYVAEEQTYEFTKGSVLFVPPWVWRTWSVSGKQDLQLLWTVFSVKEGMLPMHGTILHNKPENFELLRSRMKNLFEIWTKGMPTQLLFEAEFKAILTHFFLDPTIGEQIIHQSEKTSSHRHPEVEYAISWLQAHYMIPSALAELQEQITLNVDYFRDLFHKQMHKSPNRYLTMLRMRAARYYLSESSMSIKEVAIKTGYPDAQYFSRSYRKFWKHAPSAERS